MKTHKLVKQTCLNPYFIEQGAQVEKIHFFGNGEIIATSSRGWLPMYGTNSSGNSALESIEYRRKRKADLMADYSFFIGGDLYVNVSQLDGFLYAPDVMELETKTARYYGNHVYFVCGSTDGRFPHLEKQELRSFMVGCYSKIVPTKYGKKVEQIKAVFNESGIKMSSYDAEKILDNADTILAAMECNDEVTA